jgi:DNA-binding NarL/FixJ family response regulator
VHTPSVAGEKAPHATLEFQRGGIAVLDSDGLVTWTDDTWIAKGDEGGLPRAPIGTNLVEAYRRYDDPRPQAIAKAIVAVFDGKATYFEIEHRATSASHISVLTSVAALRGEGAGAVVIHKVVAEREPIGPPRLADVKRAERASIGVGFERLTPREREVLDLMATGLDNRAIAAKLAIQYTTVRGHVRSVIEKIGARSRLEAVARAYQMGLVPS